MFNFKQILLLAAALPSACLAGCSPPASQDSPSPPLATAQATQAAQPKIGFIDVSRVFQMTGLQDQRNAKLEELKQRQNNLEKEGQNALQKKLREFGGDLNKLTDEQKQELQQIQSALLAARRNLAAEAQQVMQETDQLLNNIYYHKTADPIRKIAEARGLDAVLVVQRNLFAYVNPETDITEEVIKQLELDAAPPQATENATKSPPTDSQREAQQPPLPGDNQTETQPSNQKKIPVEK